MFKQLKKSIFTVLCLLAVTNSAQALVLWDGHPDGDEHVYTVVALPGGNWGDANAAAQALGDGWHLATVTGAAEQSFIVDSLLANLEGKYWLGGVQDETAVAYDAGWNWVTGEAWDYTSWAPTEPNDFGGQVQRWLLTDSNSNWEWGDFRYSSSRLVGFVAEKAVPEPSTIALLGFGLTFLGFIGRRRKK